MLALIKIKRQITIKVSHNQTDTSQKLASEKRQIFADNSCGHLTFLRTSDIQTTDYL